MILDTTQLRTILHNVLDYYFDEDGFLHLFRFTPSQRQAYIDDKTRDWVAKSRSSASATLEFITDSDYIALLFTILPGSSQKYGSFDLYVDGAMHASRSFEEMDAIQAGFQLPPGEHRVTVYFPWTTETILKQVHLSDGASVIPVEKSCRMMCFGDSITQGYIAKYTSLSYVNQVARALDAEVINQGVGGYVFTESAIDESIRVFKPDIITVAYGSNDYSRIGTLEAYAERTAPYIKKMERLFPDVPIVGILPIYRNDHNNVVRELYRDYKLDDARKFLKECYLALPNGYVIEETGIPHLSQFFAADLLHPNDFGFTLMAQGIVSKLQAILDARQ